MARSIDYTHLSDTERLLLAQELIGSVAVKGTDVLLTPEQMAELDRSFFAVQRGEEMTYSLDEVLAGLPAKR